MPLRFIRTERAIEKKMKAGKIPMFYYEHGHRYKSNPYALARHAIGYHGSTHEKNEHMKHNAHKTAELILRGNDRYIHHMYGHLRKEHPSTRHRMKMKGGY